MLSKLKKFIVSTAIGVALLLGGYKGSHAAGNVYYISFSAGANTNNGTTATTPWKSHPYMSASTSCGGAHGTYAHAAGDTFYFKMGDSWPNACFPITPTAGGASGTPDLYTYTSSFGTAPSPAVVNNAGQPVGVYQFNAGNAVIGTNCNNFINFQANNISNVTINGAEFTGYLYSTNSCSNGSSSIDHAIENYQSTNNTIQNIYFHNWKHGSDGSDDLVVFAGYNTGGMDAGSCLVGSVINGIADSGTSGEVMYGIPCAHDNLIENMSNGLIPNEPSLIYNNDIGPITSSYSGAADHSNCIETDGPYANSGTSYIYSNYCHDGAEAWVILGGNDSSGPATYYFFNNIISMGNTAAPNVPIILMGSASGGLHGWNNTISSGTIDDACVENQGTYGVIDWKNNLCISNHSFDQNNVSYPNNSLMNSSNATTAGLSETQTYPFQPSSGCGGVSAANGCPIGQGSNLTSSATGSLASLQNETTAGGLHTPDARPTTGSWDNGAYFLNGSAPPVPTITTTSLPNGTVGTAYSQTVSATGGTPAYTWSISAGSLPPPLTINASSGVISGTPTTAGTYSFTVKVTDSNSQTATQALSIVISSGTSGPTITTTSLPNGELTVAYSQTVAATGGTTPYTWSISAGALPTSLTINSSSGLISGTPTASGTFSFTVKVTDTNSLTATQALSIIIAAAPSITTASLGGGNVGTAYSQTVAATGGVTPYTWSISVGTLPAGLSIGSSTGTISGNPTTTGTSNFTVQVKDTNNVIATKALSIVISAATGGVTRYVAQTAGTFSGGSVCNGQTTISVATFNTTTNSAGNTDYLCGTITTPLTPKGSGSASGVVSIIFDTGANISPAAGCGNNGCIDLDGLAYYLVDGSPTATPCGYVAAVDVACNGYIQTTGNGTGESNNASVGVFMESAGANNIELRNFGIYNMYVHTGTGNDTNGSSGSTYCIHIVGTNMNIHNLVEHDCYAGIVGEVTSSNIQYHNNQVYNINWGVFGSGSFNPQTILQWSVYDNDIHDWANWDTSSDYNHHDGIFFAGNDGTATDVNGVLIYNNYIHGHTSNATTCPSSCMTAMIYVMDAENVSVYNNILIANSGDYLYNGFIFFETITNNLPGIIAANNLVEGGMTTFGMGPCIYAMGVTQMIFENNVMSNCPVLFWYATGSTFKTLNNNIYQNTSLTDSWQIGGQAGSGGTLYSTIATWRTATGAEAASQATTGSLGLSSTYTPNAGSIVLNAGANLTSLDITTLNSDFIGNARPSTGAWTAGPYQSGSAPPTVLPPTQVYVIIISDVIENDELKHLQENYNDQSPISD